MQNPLNAIFLLLFILCAAEDGEFGHYRWRYFSSDLDPTRFYLDRDITLQFLGDLQPTNVVTWTVPAECAGSSVQTQLTGAVVVTRCSTVGEKKFMVSLDSDAADTFYVTVRSNPGCYDWYVVTCEGLGASGGGTCDPNKLMVVPAGCNDDTTPACDPIVLRMWIFDLSSDLSSAEERSGTALEPSERSKRLTREFQMLGELPSPTYAEFLTLVPSDSDPGPVFNTTHLYWTALYYTYVPDIVSLTVSGRGVSVLNCVVRDRSLTFAAAPPSFDSDLIASSFPTAPIPSSSAPLLQTGFDACVDSLGYALLNDSKGFVMTQSSFYHYAYITPFLDGNDITDVHVGRKVLVATTGGLYYSNMKTTTTTANDGTSSTTATLALYPSTGLEGVPISAIQLAGGCDNLLTPYGNESSINFLVFAWTNPTTTSTATTASLYLSADMGVTFSLRTVPSLVPTGYSICAALPLLNLPVHLLLLDYSTYQQLVLYDHVDSAWTLGYTFDDNELLSAKGASPKITASESGSGDLFLWGARLYYSVDGGYSVHKISLQSRDKLVDPTGLADDEYITQVITSKDDAFAGLTSKNRLFYGFTGLASAIELQSGEKPSSFFTITFDTFGNLQVLTLNTTTSTIDIRRVPVVNEVSSPRAPESSNPNDRCPYIDMATNVSSMYYIDMEENGVFSVSLIPRQDQGNTLNVALSDNTRLDFSVTNTFTPQDNGKIISNLQIVTLIEADRNYDNYTERVRRGTGTSDVRVMPKEYNLRCPTGQTTSRVRIGCPPLRHVEMLNKGTDPSQCSSYGPGADGRSATVNGVSYNFTRFGCPFEVYHGTPGFLPGLQLFDGDTYVEEVTADFVIWEVNNKQDFKFNATAVDVSCNQAPQTFSDMYGRLAVRDGSEDSFRKAWGPWNYVPCWNTGGSGASVDQIYEVLNSTGNNAIVIQSTARDGVMMFTARVVDPTYSYCDLTADFAILVYGAPMDIGTALLILGTAMTVILLLLAASYFYYRKKKLHLE